MRTRQVRPEKLDFEYELIISREIDNLKKQEYILFDIHTIKLFENFIYKINVIAESDPVKKILKFDIEGLSAPIIDISKSGHASFHYKFYEFKNVEYTLNLSKYGKGKIAYKFKIIPSGVKLISSPKNKFINVTVK